MMTDDPYWMNTTPEAAYPTLTKSRKVDVAVIGGGLTGLHAALKILEEDPSKKVAIIEADRICSDASGRNMGKVTVSHSKVYPHFSEAQGRAYVEANEEGFSRIFGLVGHYDIDCDLEQVSNYIFASTKAEIDQVRKDFEAMKSCGLDVEWVEPRDAGSKELPIEFLAGVKHSAQAIYHPRKFALGLLKAIEQLGGRVFERTQATDILEHDKGVTISVNGGLTLEAEKAIVATRIGLTADEPFVTHLFPWRGHLSAWSFARDPIRNAYIRYEPPVKSFRPNESHLILSGGDVKALAFEDEKHYQELLSWVQKTYPEQGTEEAMQKASFWWGEDVDSEDMLPLIGAYRQGSERIFMATGYCGWGMAKSAFAGIVLADLVAGRDSRYLEYFDPWRFVG